MQCNNETWTNSNIDRGLALKDIIDFNKHGIYDLTWSFATGLVVNKYFHLASGFCVI